MHCIAFELSMVQQASRFVCTFLGLLAGANNGCAIVQALHALCLTEPAMCMPADDPERFCRCLAPYMKAGAKERRVAEQLMCILYVEVGHGRHLHELPLSTRCP